MSPVDSHRLLEPPERDELALRDTRKAMRWSLWVGFFMFASKVYAYAITGSAAILSDAAESVVHVLAVSFAAYSLWLSVQPPDQGHQFGHDRISFFSAGFEGAMIVIAALFILYEAVMKWITGLKIERIDEGTLWVALATVVNAVLGWYLVHKGRKYRSLILEANGKHVLTDSWTSLGVIVGLVLVMATGWREFDPIVAILVALNILWSGGKLMRRSVGGLMDEADPGVHERLVTLLEEEAGRLGIRYHDLRHRNAGAKLNIEVHLLFPAGISVAQAHEQATTIEKRIQQMFSEEIEILTHLEPIEGHDEVHVKGF